MCPSFKKSPKIGGLRELLETILAFSKRTELELGYNIQVHLTLEKEVQDSSCRGVWGCPPVLKIPQDWGI